MTTPTPCADARELEDLLRGRLAPPRMGLLEHHVAGCRACTDRLNRLRLEFGPLAHSNPMGETCSVPAVPPPRDGTRYLFLAPPEAPDEIGRLGGYRVLAPLGEGGMGVVFRAEDPRLQRPVALKVVRPEIAANETARKRFLQEARHAAKVKDDHVVVIYQVGEDRGVPFLAMEYLEGLSLEAWLGKGRRPTTAQILRIGREIALGLAAAHERGLTHRDVKPANLWLESAHQGRVKILDFGLARVAEGSLHLTQTGAVVGTPSYMSPEQARGEPVDARSDLFSLGVVLYRLCAGRLPFQAKSVPGVLLALSSTEPTPVRQLNPAVPPALADLVARLMAKDAARRPASAREAASALHALERIPTATADMSATAEAPVLTPPRPQRRRWRWVAAALLLPALALGLYLALRGVGGPRADPGPAAKLAPDAAGPLADRENPFVLVRADGRREEFKTFGAAAAVLAAGDAVEVDGNGPFAVPHCALTNGLTLRAGAGYRPRLVGAEESGLEGRAWIEILGGPLTLEGCDFVPPDETHAGFSTGGNLTLADHGPSADPWTLRGCRFFSHNPKTFVYSGPELRAEDCLISQTVGHGFSAITLVGPNGRLDLSNCVVQSTTTGVISCGCGQRLRLRNNTILATGSAVVLDNLRPQTDGPMTVEATGNLLQGGGIITHNLPGGLEALKPFIRWQGRDNLYVGARRDMFRAEAEALHDLAAWNKFWGRDEPGSAETDRAHFRCEALRWQGPAEALAGVRERADALRGVGDVGPRWDFVGPGDAYLRALKRDGGAAAPARGRPDPLEGGPFVLIREGKALRGYLRLQDATGAAGAGDVIEVRGDGPYEGTEIVGETKRLTLRAAPGYRPVIQGAVVFHQRATITVEGLHFRKGGLRGDYGGNFDGRLARLAHCSFDADAPVRAIFPTTEGRPAEVTGCVVAAVLEPHIEAGDQLAIRDSVIINITPYWVKAAGALELAHCLVWTNGYNEYEASIRSDQYGFGPKGLIVACERTLVETDCFLLKSELVAWRGSHNLFAVAAWDFEQPAGGLAEWQKRWGGDADSTTTDPLGYDPQEWALLPGSPGRRARADGKDYGADTGRIAVGAPAR